MLEELRDRLNKVKEDNWLQKLREIEKGVEAYERDFSRSSSVQSKQIVEKHLNPVLPEYWEVFHTHNISRRMDDLLPNREQNNNLLPKYEVGIFLVGFNSLPIVLSLAEIQPTEQIYFLYSSESATVLHEISDRIRVMLNDSNLPLVELVEDTVLNNLENAAFEIDDPANPVSTFKRIKELIDRIGDKSVALDLTGGKKTMIGGGFIAGSILTFIDDGQRQTCDMFYTDSLAFDPNRGTPTPGTEFLSLLESPYDVYNVQTNLEAEQLFERHNYEVAANLWKGVRDKLEKHATHYGLEKEKTDVVNCHRKANCYSYWDAFYYDKAKNLKNRHGDSWGYNENHVHPLGNHTHSTIDVLDILSEVNDRKSLFKEEARVIHYSVDRYQNAIRRKESGRPDDAIVRFTQVIEMLCSYKIYQIAQDNGFVDVSSGTTKSIDPIKGRFISDIIRFLFGKSVLKDGNASYRVSDTDRLLDISKYGASEVNDLIDLIDYRNDFIHFNSSMKQQQTKTNVDALQDFAKKFLEEFSSDYCDKTNDLSFENLLKLHEFQPLE